MKISRRKFLGAGAALTATLGCDQAEKVRKALFVGVWPPAPDKGPFNPPESESIDLIAHALNRVGFGPRPGDYARVKKMGSDEPSAFNAFVEEQLNHLSIDDSDAEYSVRRFESLSAPQGEMFEYKEKFLLDEMTRAAVLRATLSKRQLHEAMVHFWTDHFNIDVSKGDCKWLKATDDREVIRANALGRFPELLRASALSPAMLWYLDGRVNRKAEGEDKPNENYARELMELHTLGVHGGYTQRDVMEVARCLTGWTVRSKEFMYNGKVEFQAHLHDDGEKEVLGRRIPAGGGKEDLERVLDVVSLHPSTARHLATKLCRRFIADDPPAGAVSAVADAFTASAGDIPATLRALFSTEEFQGARGTKFKRPFHFIVSTLRATGARTDAGDGITDFLLRMGHAPFQYPTPDGYPDEATHWMGTLLWRWNFAVALTENKIAGTKIDRAALVKNFGGEENLMAHLLGRRPTPTERDAAHSSSSGLALILASPGFQRC